MMQENNRQYYEGAQSFVSDAGGTAGQVFTTTFNTDLIFNAASSATPSYALNNFKLYTSPTGAAGTYTEYTSPYTVSSNAITITGALAANTVVVVQLKKLDGGNYGNTVGEKAFGNVVEKNYGSYAYAKLGDLVNNFLVAYVGPGKLVPSVKRTDVIFHVKRAIQEFSYDTLKSVNAQELTVPKNLSVLIPQDYVNYVELSWSDNQGVKHIIQPTRLTSNPSEMPLQDNQGVPMQDAFDENVEVTSIIEKRWKNNKLSELDQIEQNSLISYDYYYANGGNMYGYGQLYGLEPELANVNGSFTINEREGKFSFSSNLVDKIILLEYISDGLSNDLDTKVPKMAEQAVYAYVMHAVLASRVNQPEYIIQRLKKEASAKLRNAKIRLSNIKSNEIVQVMRGKSKWIKH
ncbi:MAG: hypothetical protein GY787_17635 [Alteromonadales bacterium]|nr:hypothetical protein [Alteromonadales bacterium]